MTVRTTGPRPSRFSFSSLPIGPVLAAVALVVIAMLSNDLLGGGLPLPGGAAAKQPVGNVPDRTPNPVTPFQPAVPVAPQVRGTIVFSKAGNIWATSGADVLTQITSGGTDGSPTFSPDGSTIYFVRTGTTRGAVPCSAIAASGCIAAVAPYTLNFPQIEAVPAAGGTVKLVKSGIYSWGGQYTYFFGLYQPALSPDGKTFALISDAPNALGYDYQVVYMALAGGTLTRPPLLDDPGLGHNDPAWSPDGTTVAFTYNHRSGALGAPKIALLTVKTGVVREITGFGYAQPSFSPDGRYLAAVKTGKNGRDVVILDARSGAEILRVTSDGESFAPVWSPAGDQIAFLRANGQGIDLWLDTLAGSGQSLTVTSDVALTSQSLLDGTSKPAWFIPADQMPTPSPASTASASPAGAPAASAGTSGTPATTGP